LILDLSDAYYSVFIFHASNLLKPTLCPMAACLRGIIVGKPFLVKAFGP